VAADPEEMSRARNILVGFDGSDAARRALDAAVDLGGYGSRLSVVAVAPEGSSRPGALAEARDLLVARQVAASYFDAVGEPAEELIGAAARLDADVIVVGRRKSALQRLVLGSVSARVVRRAPCDVLVVR
jgi:nucleotide-binding universal stress UspA family protein